MPQAPESERRMSRFEEHLCGRIAVLNGCLTQGQLQECLEYQKTLRGSNRRPIGEILLERGYLTEKQLTEILDVRKKKLRKMLLDSKEIVRTERTFGQLALRRGLINLDQLESALLEQQRLRRINLRLCLGDILVSLGFLTVAEVLDILTLQNNRILVCLGCESHFTVQSYSTESEYRCKNCQSLLEVPAYLDTVTTDGVLGHEDLEEAKDSVAMS